MAGTNPILITGSKGQLAQAFIVRLEQIGQAVVAPAEEAFDLSDVDMMAGVMKAVKPSVLINCAAYNAVDAAESDEAGAYAINATAVEQLATLCSEYDCRFVHYGSDYAFNGETTSLYIESSEASPLNVYGQSKLAGEKFALEYSEALVLRVSWVFGAGQQNFLYKLRQWARGAEFIRVTADETSVPSYTEDIVATTLVALEQGLSGLFHANNSGYASRYEWAKLFLRHAAPDVLAIPVPLSEFPSPAKRPHFTAMDNKLLSEALSIEIPHWHDAVQRYLEVS